MSTTTELTPLPLSELPIDPPPRHSWVASIAAAIWPPAVGFGAVLLVWIASIAMLDVRDFVLPGPLDVFDALVTNRSILLDATWPTLQEILLGFILAIGVAIPLAVALASSRRFSRIVYPVLVVSQTVPKVAIAPLFIVWFGFGMTPKILIAFLIAFFPIVVDTTIGLRAVPIELSDLARSTGGSRTATFFKIRLPYALPNIFGGLKIGITFATIGAIVGEFVGTDQGLGYVIQIANGRLNTALVFAAVLCLSVMGVLLYYLVDFVERISIPWHVSQRPHTTGWGSDAR